MEREIKRDKRRDNTERGGKEKAKRSTQHIETEAEKSSMDGQARLTFCGGLLFSLSFFDFHSPVNRQERF